MTRQTKMAYDSLSDLDENESKLSDSEIMEDDNSSKYIKIKSP